MEGAHYIPVISGTQEPPERTKPRRTAMKTIASALIALSLLTSIASAANAFDAKTFYEQQDRTSH